MSKIHTIKHRLKSVGKIGQITKAMEKVAASKRRKAQQATMQSRPYAQSAREILADLYILKEEVEHPLFKKRAVKKRLLVLFSSDRGLAGAFNSNLFRAFLAEVQKENTAAVQAIAIGQKASQFLSRLGNSVTVVGAYTNWPTFPKSTDIQPIAQTVIKFFLEGEVDQVDLLYTDFISTMEQKVRVRQLLPIDASAIMHVGSRIGTTVKHAAFEPSPERVLDFIVPRLLEVQLYQASLESSASEQAMRMVAMKNASDNAMNLVDDLTLTYNSARQASITQELAEISAGVAALE